MEGAAAPPAVHMCRRAAATCKRSWCIRLNEARFSIAGEPSLMLAKLLDLLCRRGLLIRLFEIFLGIGEALLDLGHLSGISCQDSITLTFCFDKFAFCKPGLLQFGFQLLVPFALLALHILHLLNLVPLVPVQRIPFSSHSLMPPLYSHFFHVFNCIKGISRSHSSPLTLLLVLLDLSLEKVNLLKLSSHGDLFLGNELHLLLCLGLHCLGASKICLRHLDEFLLLLYSEDLFVHGLLVPQLSLLETVVVFAGNDGADRVVIVNTVNDTHPRVLSILDRLLVLLHELDQEASMQPFRGHCGGIVIFGFLNRGRSSLQISLCLRLEALRKLEHRISLCSQPPQNDRHLLSILLFILGQNFRRSVRQPSLRLVRFNVVKELVGPLHIHPAVLANRLGLR